MTFIKNIFAAVIVLLTVQNVHPQDCGKIQSLTVNQQTQLKNTFLNLEVALNNEDLATIESLSGELKSIYATQAGLPDAAENYYSLVNNNQWLSVTEAVELSRILIARDSLVYVDLWKMAKGMLPPSYQPNSIFLRASAEIAAGLLKIAAKEPDVVRKEAYQLWATKALDSLATMQLPNGAFPFPDLRVYGDPVFSSIIQNFLESVGVDSVNVLQNGWIIDDRGTGEFKFDAGVIANAFYEAYQYTGNEKYKNIVISTGNYLKNLTFNINYNYNTFASLGLTRAYQLTNDNTYLERAIENIRYAVYPGQMENGRWIDGHNASSRYHSIIIKNIVPTIQLLPTAHIYKDELNTMANKAVKNMVDYANTCGVSTSYGWLIKANQLNSEVISSSLKDSIQNLIGQHVNQSKGNGKFLDVPIWGEFLESLGVITALDNTQHLLKSEMNIYPNPTMGAVSLSINLTKRDQVVISIYQANGQLLKTIMLGTIAKGAFNYKVDLLDNQNGLYFFKVETSDESYLQRIIKL